MPAALTSAQLVSAGVRPELLVSLALRRVAGGGVAKWGDGYFDGGRGTPSWLAGVFDELVSTGLLALAEQPDHPGLRVSLTHAGQLRYQQLRTMPVRAAPSEPRDTGPEITGGSPVDSERPPTLHPWWPAGHCAGGWCDVDGAAISLFDQVEQVADDSEPTVLDSRLHQPGRVVGRSRDWVYVCFSDHQVISVRPHLLRVLHTDPDND